MESLQEPTHQAASSTLTSVVEHGVLTGITGATVVAVWFVILDLARGQIFLSPSLLGSVLFLGRSPDQVTSVNDLIVFACTGLHGVLSSIVPRLPCKPDNTPVKLLGLTSV